jgi:hypothetical protein
VPCIVGEAKIQDYLWHDGVDGAVEDPAFDGKGEVGEREVLVRPKEDMGDEAVGTALPF